MEVWIKMYVCNRIYNIRNMFDLFPINSVCKLGKWLFLQHSLSDGIMMRYISSHTRVDVQHHKHSSISSSVLFISQPVRYSDCNRKGLPRVSLVGNVLPHLLPSIPRLSLALPSALICLLDGRRKRASICQPCAVRDAAVPDSQVSSGAAVSPAAQFESISRS